MIGKTAVVYVPELAYSLKDKGLSNKEARDKILEDFGNKNPWTDRNIYRCFPKELRDPDETRGRSFEISSKKREEAAEQINDAFKPIPKLPGSKAEPEEEESSEGFEVEGIDNSQLQKLAGSDKTVLTKLGDVSNL